MKPLKLLCLVLPLTFIAAGFKSEPEKANEFSKLLLQAVAKGDIAQVKSHLSKGADVNTRDETGRLPLHYAVAGKHKDIVELLTAAAVRPGTFEHKELGRVKRLLDQGIDVNAIGHSNTLLHLAAQAGYAYVAAYLIVHGADVDARNSSGQTPTQVAMRFIQPITALLLLDAGAVASALDKSAALFLTKGGLTASRWAKQEDREETVQSSGGRSVGSGSRENHDVAISKVSAVTRCIRGDFVPITVTVENRGCHRESFNIVLLDGMAESPIAVESAALAVPLHGGVHNAADIVFATETLPRAMFGNRVCIGGDVNGDGFADVLIGSLGWQDFCGRAHLYFGGRDMDTHPEVVFTGEEANVAFSNQSGTFGDVNGDGFDDVIIGAPGTPSRGDADGQVYVYHGGPGMDNVPDVIFSPEAGKRGRFGKVSAAADVDNNGYCDILIGEPYRERAYLFWGGNPMNTSTKVVFEGKNTGNYFGHRMAMGGDVNGDGYNDIVIGARAGGRDQEGQVYLYFGNTKQKMDTECDWLFTGEARRNNLGSAVDIFDIDNDGYDDVIMAGRYANNLRGRVYIYWGAEHFDGSEPGVILERQEISSMGAYLECGHFNGDSYGDILVGGWQYPGPPYKHGRAYLFYGNTKASMDTLCDHIFEGEGCTEDYFGFHVAVGDVNNDGYTDALIAEPGANHWIGRAHLFYGPFDETTDITFNWDTTNATPGKHVLRASIAPVAGEEDTANNTMTVTVEVKGPYK